MRAVSLFSGAGGFELGFDRAGIETVLQCEIDPTAQKVLRHHWPGTELIADVRDVGRAGDAARDADATGGSGSTEARSGLGVVDLVYGGFPCQPFSVAGKRAGDRDDRNLWPEFRRVVRELRPAWVVAENVPGLLSFDHGRFFGSILDDLGELGFEGVAYAVLDAQHFGVPQRRRRVFVVAGPSRRAVEQVLSLCEGCGGNPAPGRAPGEDVAADATASAISASAGHHGHSSPRGDGADNLIANPLPGHHARQDLDNDTYVMAVRTAPTGSNGWGVGTDGQAYTLDGATQAVLAPTLDTHLGDKQWLGDQDVENFGLMDTAGAGVRRLTPLECERLMAWPDDWTRYADDGSEISDSHRYRLAGNGVVSTVAEWIGRRLVAVDERYHDPRGGR